MLAELRQKNTFDEIFIGHSAQAVKARQFAENVGNYDETVFLQGPTGSGKNLMAKMIHCSGGRCPDKFVTVNCANLPEPLLESELFGHVRGAFTGAFENRRGLLEVAEGGTLFLDEIGNMPLNLQPKILQFLDGGTFRKVGGTKEVRSNIRIIVATNNDLKSEMEKGAFRMDLYYRINEISFVVPALRERREDIPVLAEHFLRKKSPSKQFTPRVMTLMMDYNWPGNVRELKNTVSRGAFFSAEDDKIGVEHLESTINIVCSKEALKSSLKADDGTFLKLHEIEKKYLCQILQEFNGNMAQSAGVIGISSSSIYRKIEKFQLKDFVGSLRKGKCL